MATEKKYIIVQLSGGLGNQMFQYAFGKAIAHKLGYDYYVDKTLLKKPYLLGKAITKRQIELDVFCLSLNKEYKPFVINIGFHKLSLAFYKLYNKIYFKKNKIDIVVQNELICPQEYLDQIKKNSYLIGTFQSEKYFDIIKDDLQNDFSFKYNFNEKNKSLESQINVINAVSVHVRRGDYLLEHNFKHHGICGVEYYNRAINLIKNKVADPVFFVFSDDIEWTTENITFGDSIYHYVNHNTGNDSHNDMRLMSLCNHNIIANSSFSWWGAWLNKNKGKIVIAPSVWLNDDRYKLLADNIVPANWTKI